ncbi:MAG: hypothetical protein ACRDM9_14280, partial [Gaiellaceae bacterium]
AAELQAAAIRAVNAGRVPAELQEELGAAVNALAAEIECVPPPAQNPAKDNGKRKGKGKAKGRDKDEQGGKDGDGEGEDE